jgi:signal transduction histidine kinase
MDQAAIASLVRNFSFLDVPIGVYVVAPDGRFLACNRSVRHLLHLPLEGAVNARLADFYADAGRRKELLQKAIEAEERGWYLEKEVIHFRVKDRDIYVEDYCKPLRDPATREIVGYVGCLVDVTEEHALEEHESELQNRVDELVFDIGRVLHANTSTLLMAQQTLDGAAEALSQRALNEVLARSSEEMDDEIVRQAEQLANAIEKMIESVDADRRLKALPEARWEELTTTAARLRRVRDIVPGMEMRSPALRRAAREVTLICQEMSSGALARELIKDVVRTSTQLESSACLIDVLMARTAIIQMDTTLRSLRDFITGDVRAPEPKKRLSVKELTEQAINHLKEFARSSRVELVWKDRDFDAEVEGVERDLQRALQNLLHNAIKYSWRRDRARAPWITVRHYVRDQMVCVEFENWGVPIAQDEIEQGLIFQLGYRGKWSKDRGRLGTGIGLTDAKRTALAHRGDLQITSRPAAPGSHQPDDPKYYDQPFITTVTLCLPMLGKR